MAKKTITMKDGVKPGDDKKTLKAGTKDAPTGVYKIAKSIDDVIEKKYPNYTGPNSAYAGVKSAAKTLLGYKKGGVTKEHPITTFRKANEARDMVVKASMKKMQTDSTVNSKKK